MRAKTFGDGHSETNEGRRRKIQQQSTQLQIESTYAAHRRVLVLLRLLDAVAVVLVTLIVVGVVLGLGHGELEKREWR